MKLEEVFLPTHPGDVGIFGDPIEHTLSPLMQNAAFKTWQLAFKDGKRAPALYHKFRVEPNQLKEAVALVKKHQLRGVNITIPHKVAVCHYLDALDPFAEKVGCVNTLVLQSGKLKGFNTDGDGFRLSLEQEFGPKEKIHTALVLGSGGTGRVIVQALLKMGKKIGWWNRHFLKIESLLKDKKNKEMLEHVTLIKSDKDLAAASAVADLVVNATPVGLSPEDGMPASSLHFREGQCVFDVIYHRETRFMQEAKAAGSRVCGGLSMLVHQGARSFELWTGAPAPREVMWKALLESFQQA